MTTLPGERLLAAARLWFDEATIDRVFEPLVADWQAEYASAPAGERRRIWLAGLTALFTTSIEVIGRCTRREASRPPAAIETAKLVGTALVSCALFALLVKTLNGGPTPTVQTLAMLVLVVFAGLIWPPRGPAMERPLSTYLKLSAGLVFLVAIFDGPDVSMMVASFVPIWAGVKLPPRTGRGEVRRMGLAFGPIALLAFLSPAINDGSWPMAWRGALLFSWSVWSVLACSLDATRMTKSERRGSLNVRRL